MTHKLIEADKTKRMNERVIDVMMDSMEELLEMKDSISLANQEIGKHGGNAKMRLRRRRRVKTLTI
jgi:hypothetical protein